MCDQVRSSQILAQSKKTNLRESVSYFIIPVHNNMISTLLGLAAAVYDPEVASYMAKASNLAYLPADQILNTTCAQCSQLHLNNLSVFQSQTYVLQVVVAYNPKRQNALVAFRGTKNLPNLVEDFKGKFADYPGCQPCKAHSGFLQSWQQLRPFVLSQLAALKTSTQFKAVDITGHSLGGAITTFCGLQLGKTYTLGDVYTFGEPRVGNKDMADYTKLHLQRYRVVHYHDVVPHLPPYPIFQHSEEEIWYTESMQVYRSCKGGEDENCSRSVPVSEYSLDDHSLNKYMQLPPYPLTVITQ